MTIRLGIVMDPIASIKVSKDSSFAMLLAAQARGWSIHYMEQKDLFLNGSTATAQMSEIEVRDQASDWFTLGEPRVQALANLDVILMRKDPPLDMEYLYSTFILERAEVEGVLVVNKPSGLRNSNEKLFTTWFDACCAPSVVTKNASTLRQFLDAHGDIILKPLDAMGGASIFRVRKDDPNISVIFETLTDLGQKCAMAQRFIPEISAGDKRILMINGEPIPYALARIPAKGETRGNLAAGGKGIGVKLTERDLWICRQVGPELRRRGLVFVGLDVIGDYLTEINVTSPTCIREINSLYDLDIAGSLMDWIEAKLRKS